jgi:hypothetical protein
MIESNNVKRILAQLQEDIDKTLSDYFRAEVFNQEFPVSFTNDAGDWVIHKDGQVLFKPKSSIQHITVTIDVKK